MHREAVVASCFDFLPQQIVQLGLPVVGVSLDPLKNHLDSIYGFLHCLCSLILISREDIHGDAASDHDCVVLDVTPGGAGREPAGLQSEDIRPAECRHKFDLHSPDIDRVAIRSTSLEVVLDIYPRLGLSRSGGVPLQASAFPAVCTQHTCQSLLGRTAEDVFAGDFLDCCGGCPPYLGEATVKGLRTEQRLTHGFVTHSPSVPRWCPARCHHEPGIRGDLGSDPTLLRRVERFQQRASCVLLMALLRILAVWLAQPLAGYWSHVT